MKIIGSNPLSDFLEDDLKIKKSINRVLYSGSYVLGNEVNKFEKEFAKFIGSKFCVTVANGTEALYLSLKSLEIGRGDEVITTPHTAVATISAISLTGAKPVFVDIEEDYFTIDPKKIIASINKNTKAILPVHIYGQSADMDEIMKIAKEYKLFVIEDCSQSHGTTYKKIKTGNIGHMSCFSFYPTKNLGCLGDGGAIVTNNILIRNKLILYREYGWKKKFNSITFGINSRLDEIQAAVLRVKLKSLNKFNSNRIKIAKNYINDLADKDIILPKIRSKTKHVFHLFVIKSKKRDLIKKELEKKNIFTSIQYPIPIHKQRYYKKFSNKNLKISEKISKQILSLPIYPSLKYKDYKHIVFSLTNILENEK